jgi:5-methyltetrahydropteroyltriglutamate--homocysteine methyltransferase
MATKIVDKILPTTMVGSYPRPSWYKQQLLGRDIRVAFKEVSHEETYDDAVAAVVRDQEDAGLDIVTDGNMWYDDYVGVIGSFCWYMYERIGGFEPAREPHPSMVGAEKSAGKALLDDWGGVINSGPVTRGPSGSPICTRLPAATRRFP